MGRKERSGPPDEKVTINLGPVDLGRIDLLVEQGFYASRTDAIRSATRQLLDGHKVDIDEAVRRNSIAVGVVHWGRDSLEQAKRRNERLAVRVMGVLHLGSDVTPDLADEVIESIRVLGHFSAPAPVRDRLKAKMGKLPQ